MFSWPPLVGSPHHHGGHFFADVLDNLHLGNDNEHRMKCSMAYLERERLAREAHLEAVHQDRVPVVCPSCTRRVLVLEAVGGVVVAADCPHCGARFRVSIKAA